MSPTNNSALAERARTVIESHPDLSYNGWRFDREMTPEQFAKFRTRLLTPDALAQIETVYAYLKYAEIHPYSYCLKHDVERWGQSAGMSGYVSNGCAIVGAILSGYQVARERDSPNCWFK